MEKERTGRALRKAQYRVRFLDDYRKSNDKLRAELSELKQQIIKFGVEQPRFTPPTLLEKKRKWEGTIEFIGTLR